MELLSDDSATDMSAKEIMRRWEQRGKDPSAALATSPKSQGGIAKRKDERNAPQITDADNNPTAMAGESSVRHVANKNVSPSRHPDMGRPIPPYGQNPQASAESHRTASPHRHSYRSPQYQKQQQISTTGAG
jgi:hypothetical protein